MCFQEGQGARQACCDKAEPQRSSFLKEHWRVLVQEVFKEHTSMLQQEDALPVRALQATALRETYTPT